LGQIGGNRARRILEKFLQSENEALSTAAMQAIDELDFFHNGISSFLGPPSEFDGEGDAVWFSPEGFLLNPAYGSHTAEDDLSDVLLENEQLYTDDLDES
jgi:hypothetical protein